MSEEWEELEGPGSMAPYRGVVCILRIPTPDPPDPLVTCVIATLAVAFAAFCVWLTVRIVNRRERWAKWMLAAVVGLPALYVLSFGPAHVLSDRMEMDDPLFWKFYKPIEWSVDYGPRPVRDALERYAGLWN